VSDQPIDTELNAAFRKTPGGATRVELKSGERVVSGLWIVPFHLRIGSARVRMDGIGGVGTPEEFRKRGYSRRTLEATVRHMRDGDAALSMLYGIRDYYPKFGYATAGPNHYLRLPLAGQNPSPQIPGWTVRPFRESDLPALRRIYDRTIEKEVGAAVRPEGSNAWSRLIASVSPENDDECRVVVDPHGEIRAYVWRGREFWVASSWERNEPNALILSEVLSETPAAADVAVSACLEWAAEESATKTGPAKEAILSLPPDSATAQAAKRRTAQFVAQFTYCGESMARVLNVARLLETLKPELEARWAAAQLNFVGSLTFQTDIGDAALRIAEEGMEVADRDLSEDRDGRGENLRVQLPQGDLARLALGAFAPEDALLRLEVRPDATRELLSALFPARHPHMYIPDRY
jgi:hypothetical protein